jgi:hypothetical protein
VHWHEDDCERHILEANFGRLARIGTVDDGHWFVRYAWDEKELFSPEHTIESVKLFVQVKVKQHLINAVKSLGA